MAKEASVFILRKVVIDSVIIVALVVLIYVTDATWLQFKRGFFCGDESLMFPYRDDTVTTPMLRIVGLGLNIYAFLICEWVLLRKEQGSISCKFFSIPLWLRSFYCTLVSFGLGTCFLELTTNVAKKVIGRPRPHFFDLCKPSIDCSAPEWQHRYIQGEDYTCLGQTLDNQDKFNDMHMSFLSGHSAWSAFTMMYLALYLEKRVVWRGTRVLRHSLQFGAVMLSWFTALSRVSDYKHHWSDVLAGYFLGITLACIMWTWGTTLIEPTKKHSPVPQEENIFLPTHQQIELPA
ncbi:putative phosphatidate phosphatase [Epargyreus clarus]|uniref:putative phosphatidate phosphatase n=1 Tax=Epargyreus clarus TaxID=520877 RepID=UPI003C2B6224